MPPTNLAGDLSLPSPGSPDFFPALVSHIRTSTLSPIPLDPVIFQSILLCVIAGDKHLILHTPEEDIGLVVKLVVWTLSSIFDFPTHKLKIRSRSGATESSSYTPFLRSLFLPSSSTASSSSHNFQDGDHASGHHHSRYSPSRPLKRRTKSSQHIPSTFFQDESAGSAKHGATPSNPFDEGFKNSLAQSAEAESVAVPHAPRSPRRTSHVRADQASIRTKHLYAGALELPQALVVSGLEKASIPTQRSLVKVLLEKKVVLDAREEETLTSRGINKAGYEREVEGADQVCNLPEGFIMVYVCPWNARDRPAILKGLLDRFSMSTNIFVPQSTRHALRSLPFSLSHSLSHSHSHSNPSSPSPSHSLALPTSRTPPYFSLPLPATQPPSEPLPKRILPESFFTSMHAAYDRTRIPPGLSLYLSNLFSATRHHPQLDGTLLTMRAMKDAEDFARAGRVLGVDLTGMELIRDIYDGEQVFDENEREHEDLADDVASGSATLHVPHGYQKSDYDPSVSPHDDFARNSHDQVQTLDVSEADIARIVPRVVSHRVCVRESPEDEILGSAVFGAVLGASRLEDSAGSGGSAGLDIDENDWDTRPTIKEILVNILAEV